MATERIDIVIQEQGSRVVKRSLEDIGTTAGKSSSAVDYLKRTLASLGVAALLGKFVSDLNKITELQNRLRSVGLEGQALEAIYQKLLKTSNDTRQSFESTVEMYSRLATSSKELGVSQNELIQFTKSLNQAVTLSGASAVEAKAGLIQLAQGLASGRLQGDELRSVLEQLPAVADVIARSLKVTRGELRQMGSDGKITAQVVLKAFRDAREELEQKFAKTVPTIAQAFEVLKNTALDKLKNLDQEFGISDAVSKSIMLVAQNLDQIYRIGGKAAETLVAVAAAYGVFKLSLAGSELVAAVQAARAYRVAIAEGTVVVLGSAEAERQKAVAALASAEADKLAVIQAVAKADAEGMAAVATTRSAAAQAAAAVERIRFTQAQLVAERELELVRMKAQISEIGRMQSATRLADIRKAELALTKTIAAAEAEAATAKAAATAASAAQGAQAARNAQQLATATQAVATAQGAAAAATVAAAGTTSLFSQAMNAAKAAVSALWSQIVKLFVLINAHPFVALATALAAVIGLLVVFGDDVLAGIDGITTLGDVARAFGSQAVDALKSFGSAAADAFGALWDSGQSALDALGGLLGPAVADYLTSFNGFFDGVGTGWSAVLRGTARVVDAIAGLITGLVLGITRTFGGLPQAIAEVFKRVYNEAATVIEDLLNTLINGINKVRSFVGASILETVSITKMEVDSKFFENYGQSIASSIQDGFDMQGGFAEKFIQDTFKKAQEAANMRQELQRLQGKGTGTNLDAKGTPAKLPIDKKELEQVQNALRSLLDKIYPAAGALLEMKKAQEVLTKAQQMGLITTEQQSKYLELLKLHYRDILDPVGALNREYDKQMRLLGMSKDAREVEAQVMETVQQLQRQGIVLSEAETNSIRNRLNAIQELSKVVEAQDSILSQTVEQRKQFAIQLQAIKNLLADPTSGFRKEDVAGVLPDLFAGTQEAYATQLLTVQNYYAQLEQLRQADLISDQSVQLQKLQLAEQIAGTDLFAGTQEALDLQVARFQNMYAQIDQLRKADLVSAQTAEMMRAKVAAEVNSERLKNTQSFFGNLATLSRSGNSKIAAIGRAAAVAQATIDGVLAVQKALASAPPPVNYVLAAAVGAAAAANVASIMKQGTGYESGGYTGDFGRKTVAGVVHGREFVVNASATQQHRGLLEAMNRGDLSGYTGQAQAPSSTSGSYAGAGVVSGGSSVTVVVNNNASGTVATQTERDTPDGKQIEITIEEVVTKSVRKGGRIADALENQYGLNRSAGASR